MNITKPFDIGDKVYYIYSGKIHSSVLVEAKFIITKGNLRSSYKLESPIQIPLSRPEYINRGFVFASKEELIKSL